MYCKLEDRKLHMGGSVTGETCLMKNLQVTVVNAAKDLDGAV